mmetsp:Transcript_8177/g.30347  ORF Transcript_8177/g.30347 Transcript_8177/m.30347 type:complete len:200 (+) Transcript_8177:462-1061(+)
MKSPDMLFVVTRAPTPSHVPTGNVNVPRAAHAVSNVNVTSFGSAFSISSTPWRIFCTTSSRPAMMPRYSVVPTPSSGVARFTPSMINGSLAPRSVVDSSITPISSIAVLDAVLVVSSTPPRPRPCTNSRTTPFARPPTPRVCPRPHATTTAPMTPRANTGLNILLVVRRAHRRRPSSSSSSGAIGINSGSRSLARVIGR